MRAGVYVACRATCAVCRAMTAPSIRAVPKRVRLDQLLVERGLAPSRERAQALILAGVVRVDGARADRAAAPVRDGSEVAVDPGRRYVSRGGDKLAGALDAFAVDVRGRVAIDVGASTGGFTDVLLQRGAARVHAVDVGKGQLHEKLRNDPRVVAHERMNARELALGEACSAATADLSFISLKLVLRSLAQVLRPSDAWLVA